MEMETSTKLEVCVPELAYWDRFFPASMIFIINCTFFIPLPLV
jgi:hypothetical protein